PSPGREQPAGAHRRLLGEEHLQHAVPRVTVRLARLPVAPADRRPAPARARGTDSTTARGRPPAAGPAPVPPRRSERAGDSAGSSPPAPSHRLSGAPAPRRGSG